MSKEGEKSYEIINDFLTDLEARIDRETDLRTGRVFYGQIKLAEGTLDIDYVIDSYPHDIEEVKRYDGNPLIVDSASIKMPEEGFVTDAFFEELFADSLKELDVEEIYLESDNEVETVREYFKPHFDLSDHRLREALEESRD